jgi:transposase
MLDQQGECVVKESHQRGQERVNMRDAENLLRQAAHAADPFIALYESYRHTIPQDRISHLLFEEEEDR